MIFINTLRSAVFVETVTVVELFGGGCEVKKGEKAKPVFVRDLLPRSIPPFHSVQMLLLTLLSSARTVEVAGDRDRLQLSGRTKAGMKKKRKKKNSVKPCGCRSNTPPMCGCDWISFQAPRKIAQCTGSSRPGAESSKIKSTHRAR